VKFVGTDKCPPATSIQKTVANLATDGDISVVPAAGITCLSSATPPNSRRLGAADKTLDIKYQIVAADKAALETIKSAISKLSTDAATLRTFQTELADNAKAEDVAFDADALKAATVTAKEPEVTCSSGCDDGNNDSGLSDGAIAGIVIGVLVGIGLLGAAVYFFVLAPGQQGDKNADKKQTLKPGNNGLGATYTEP